MRALSRLAALSSATLVAVACGGRAPSRNAATDVRHDLQLAHGGSAQLRINPDEVTRQSRALAHPAFIRAGTAPRAVAHVAPPAVAAKGAGDLNGPLPDARMTGDSLPTQIVGMTAAPIPAPVVPGAASAEPADRSGVFDPAHGVVPRGTVIRGGGVGDDHCDPRRDPRGGGVWGGGIFRGGGGLGSGRAIP